MFKFEELKAGDRISYKTEWSPGRVREETVVRIVRVDGNKLTLHADGWPMAEGWTVESLREEVAGGYISDVVKV